MRYEEHLGLGFREHSPGFRLYWINVKHPLYCSGSGIPYIDVNRILFSFLGSCGLSLGFRDWILAGCNRKTKLLVRMLKVENIRSESGRAFCTFRSSQSLCPPVYPKPYTPSIMPSLSSGPRAGILREASPIVCKLTTPWVRKFIHSYGLRV